MKSVLTDIICVSASKNEHAQGRPPFFLAALLFQRHVVVRPVSAAQRSVRAKRYVFWRVRVVFSLR